MEKFGVIIDGYSSGKFYPAYFKNKGIETIHIQSKVDIPEFVKGCFCPSVYTAHTVHTNMEETTDWIESFGQPAFVIPGCEIGVNLADRLSDRFQIEMRNPLSSSLHRRDKYLMQERIEQAGLRSIRQGKFDKVGDALRWIDSVELSFPVVVKPLNSTSGDGFHLCHSEAEVVRAFHCLLNQKNLLLFKNIHLIVQEYIRGTEYVIDTVSFRGDMVVTDIIQYKKRIGKYRNTVYERCDFLSIDEESLKDTLQYTESVLKALEIQYGPAHTEIIVDAKGPVLIEVGARPAGCMLDLDFIRNIYGHNQIELSGLLYSDPEAFKKKIMHINPKVKLPSVLVLYSQNRRGIVQSIDFSAVEKSKVHVKTDLNITVGKLLDEPKNLSEMHAILYLQGEDWREINQWAEKLRTQPERFVTLNAE